MAVKADMPVVEIRVSKPWLRFIYYCQKTVPNGDVGVKIVKGQPSKLSTAMRDIRFDRDYDFPEIDPSELDAIMLKK